MADEPEPGLGQRIGEAFQGEQRKATIVLLTSTPLLITWKYFGSPQFYHANLAGRFVLRDDPQFSGAVYGFAGCFLLLGLIPALIVKFLLREPLSNFGVAIGKWRRTIISFAALAPLFVVIGYFASGDPEVTGAYTAVKSPGTFAWHTFAFFWFYVGWEFHFRGYLQFGLRDSMGRSSAILVQVMASTLVHIGTPTSEIYGAILGGLLWGILAFRTGSLLSGLLQHFLLGLSVGYFVAF